MHHLAPFFGMAAAEQFSPHSLQDLVAWSMPRLGDDDDWVAAWHRLAAIVGDLPPYDKIAVDLGSAIHAINFVALAATDTRAAATAMYTAALLAQHLGDAEVLRYLGDQLVSLVGFPSENGNSDVAAGQADAAPDEDPNEAALTMLDAALAIALASASTHSLADFAEIAKRLATASSQILPASRRLGEWLGEHVPPPLAGQLWSWIVRLRAE